MCKTLGNEILKDLKPNDGPTQKLLHIMTSYNDIVPNTWHGVHQLE